MQICYFSAPGRVEIGGNHTDHQRGRVLAVAIHLETRAAARVNGSDTVRLDMDGLGKLEVDLRGLDAREGEKGSSAALVRGVAAWFAGHGYAIGGFDAEVSSDLPVGEGLSSSAAFEVLIGRVFKGLFGAEVTKAELALAGQFAENRYFGKPCGLMDQTASSFGGLNLIDFRDPQNPAVTPVRGALPGYNLCVVSTGGSHEDLTADYAAAATEMQAVASCFGKEHLREVPEEEFYASIGSLRRLGDRPVLRAIHFFGEDARVAKQASALESGDTASFLELAAESGRSSLAYLQNVFSPSRPQQQGLTLALALSEKSLAGKGAWRVHGGGFAGTILAFVPDALKEEYTRRMSGVFGEGCCRFLRIREAGA